MTGTFSYALSRFESTGGDQDSSRLSLQRRTTKFFGPTGLDRTHQLTFGLLTSLPWGINVNTIRASRRRCRSQLLLAVLTVCAEIFMSDLDGDGIRRSATGQIVLIGRDVRMALP